MRARFLTLIAAAGLSLGGCAYGGLGLGTGYGSPYGYGSYGYGDYGYGYGSPYGYGYGYGPYGGYYGSPFGWYDGFYYPGTGYYVYDSDRHRRVMTDAERQHWRGVLSRLSGKGGTTATTTRVVQRENWSGFNRRRPQVTESTSTNSGRSWRHSTTTSSSDSTISTRSTNSGRGHGRRHGDD